METINIHQAKTQLSKLIEKVKNGEEVIISKAGTPVAKIITYRPLTKKRTLGLLKGKIKIAKDFDALPDDIIDAFYK